MKISKHFTFEASHVLPRHPGKCARLHGHSWQLEIAVIGPIDEQTGFVCDYSQLKGLVDEHVVSKLDHQHLGCGEAYTGAETGSPKCWTPYFGQSFYPSSENLCRAIFKLLQPLVRELAEDVRLYEVVIKETCTSEARYGLADEPYLDPTV